MVVAAMSCQKKVEYPVEPKIAYEGFTYIFNADSTFSGEGIVSFSYTDGDGDLGLDDSDTLPPFGPNEAHYYNMVIDYLKCVNGEFVKTPLLSWNAQTQSFDTVSFNARFHRLRDNDDPKAISSPNDTIKFEIRILDRALHESNVILTDPIYTGCRDALNASLEKTNFVLGHALNASPEKMNPVLRRKHCVSTKTTPNI